MRGEWPSYRGTGEFAFEIVGELVVLDAAAGRGVTAMAGAVRRLMGFSELAESGNAPLEAFRPLCRILGSPVKKGKFHKAAGVCWALRCAASLAGNHIFSNLSTCRFPCEIN